MHMHLCPQGPRAALEVQAFANSHMSPKPCLKASWPGAETDLTPCYQDCPDLSQLLLLLTSLTALTCSMPSLAPGQSEKKGGPCRLAPWSPLPPRLYHLPPTAAAWEAAGVCTKLPAPASNEGGLGPEAGRKSQGTAPEPEGQAERGLHSSPPWPLTAQTQHPAVESAPCSYKDLCYASGPHWDTGGHRSPVAAISLGTWLFPFSAERLNAVHRGLSEGSLGDMQSLALPSSWL